VRVRAREGRKPAAHQGTGWGAAQPAPRANGAARVPV